MKVIHTDTIAAQATPPGRGGVAIVRVSGLRVKKIIPLLLQCELPPRQATYTPFYDENDNVIDEGIALFFPNPHSFTGEDVLELHGHGGPVVVDLLLQRILSLGIRLARPGEFSERAFLNGKIDLAQAEAIADLIDASSEHAARLAMRSLQGEFSREIKTLTEKVIHLRMYVEASIDFVDEEIDFLNDKNIVNSMEEIQQHLTAILQKAKQGSFLREGITAVIAGEPNVGKSSLLNCLSGKEIAIVTNVPGTTRDVLRDYILIDDMPMHIIDTAGLRTSDDIVEQEGIRRAHHEMEKADLILYVVDVNNYHSKNMKELELPEIVSSRPVIFVCNKIDLTNQTPSSDSEQGHSVVYLSAKTGDGVDLLKQRIKSLVGFKQEEQGIFLARRRHLDALHRAHAHVKDALRQLSDRKAGELAAEDLRLAQLALSEITGEFTADDLLGRIFSSFCIGK